MTNRLVSRVFRFFTLLFLPAVLTVQGAGEQRSPIRWEPLYEPGCGGWVVSLAVNPHRPDELLVGGDVLGVGLSKNRGESWEPTFGLKSIEMGDITYHPQDPNVVWIGSMSGPYRSVDGGKNWVEAREGMPKIARYHYSAPIEKIVFDPNNPKRLLAFGGNSRRHHRQEQSKFGVVWESTDSGDSWTEISRIPPAPGQKLSGANLVGATFAAGSSDILYVAADLCGIFRSDDGGKTWEKRNDGLPHLKVERIVAHPTKPETIHVSLNSVKEEGDEKFRPGSVYTSEDGGRHWTEIATGLPKLSHASEQWLSSRYKGFAVSTTRPDVMYVSDSSWNGARVYKTEDGGASWRCVLRKKAEPEKGIAGLDSAYPSGTSMTVMTVHPHDADIAYGAGSEFVVRTEDGGKSWIDVTAEQIDGGWRGRGYGGLCTINARFDPFVRGRLFILAMDAGKCWETNDFMKPGKMAWYYHGQKPDAWGCGNDIAFARDGRAYLTTGQQGSGCGVLRSEKNPATPEEAAERKKDDPWTPLHGPERGLPSRRGEGVARGVHTLPDDSTKVWVVANHRLYFSDDSGESWTKLSGVARGLPDTDCGWIAADPRTPTRFYVSNVDGVFVTNGGKTFHPIGGPRIAGRVTVDRDGRLYIAAYRGKRAGLWRFDPRLRNDTETGPWRRLKDDWHLSNVAVDPNDPSRILVASTDDPFHDHMASLGASISVDGGKTWSDENAGLPVLRGTAVAFNPFDSEQIVFGTGGCGYFVARWPNDYRPEQNYRYEHTAKDAEFAAVEQVNE